MSALADTAAMRKLRRERRTWPIHDRSRTSLQGLILWLPSWESLEDADARRNYDRYCYEHPVVILSPQSQRGMVEALLVGAHDSHPHDNLDAGSATDTIP